VCVCVCRAGVFGSSETWEYKLIRPGNFGIKCTLDISWALAHPFLHKGLEERNGNSNGKPWVRWAQWRGEVFYIIFLVFHFPQHQKTCLLTVISEYPFQMKKYDPPLPSMLKKLRFFIKLSFKLLVFFFSIQSSLFFFSFFNFNFGIFFLNFLNSILDCL